MTNRRSEQKQRTRDRIADVATRLFRERGFDEVTVQEVASAAGVSKVTVFAHFACKEDLLLDLAPLTVATVVGALRNRPAGVPAVSALRRVVTDLTTPEGPLPVLTEQVVPFLRTVSGSTSVLARVVHHLAALEQDLARALAETGEEHDPALVAALVVAACRVVFAETARQLLDGAAVDQVRASHDRRLGAAFDLLDRVQGRARPPKSDTSSTGLRGSA